MQKGYCDYAQWWVNIWWTISMHMTRSVRYAGDHKKSCKCDYYQKVSAPSFFRQKAMGPPFLYYWNKTNEYTRFFACTTNSSYNNKNTALFYCIMGNQAVNRVLPGPKKDLWPSPLPWIRIEGVMHKMVWTRWKFFLIVTLRLITVQKFLFNFLYLELTCWEARWSLKEKSI